MYNYENMISKTDLHGFWYLNSNLRAYGSAVEDKIGVQLMIIHKAKGLVPVTIISSLRNPKGKNSGFPNKFIDFSSDDVKYHNG